MLVPAVRASTAWLPTVIVDGVVVLIKKGIRYLVDRNNEKTPASLVRQPREENSILFSFRFESTHSIYHRDQSSRVWHACDRQSLYRGEEQPEREGREGVCDKRHYARPADRYDVRELVRSATMLVLPSLPKRGDGVHCGRSPHTEDSWRHEPTTRRWSRERAFRAGACGAAIPIDTPPLQRYTSLYAAPVYRRSHICTTGLRRRFHSTPLVSTYDQRPSNGLTVNGEANT